MISSVSYLAGEEVRFVDDTPQVNGHEIFARFISHGEDGMQFAMRIDCQLYRFGGSDSPLIEDCKLEG